MKIVSILLLSISLCITAYSKEDNPTKIAETFFEDFRKLGDTFDPKITDLYSDNAIIKIVRIYPNDTQKTMVIPAPKYKKLIRMAIPVAKQRGDTSSFKNIKYSMENDNYRIIATRHSNLKNYDSTYSLLLKKDENDNILIIEELIESKP